MCHLFMPLLLILSVILYERALYCRSDASRQVENLQIQLHAIANQRDNALLQLANAQETITSYANSLTNLQMVLEQFQAGQLSVCVD